MSRVILGTIKISRKELLMALVFGKANIVLNLKEPNPTKEGEKL